MRNIEWWAVDVKQHGKTVRILGLGEKPEVTIVELPKSEIKPVSSVIRIDEIG